MLLLVFIISNCLRNLDIKGEYNVMPFADEAFVKGYFEIID